MFIRNGQALGSVNHAVLAVSKAERPKPPKPATISEPEPVSEKPKEYAPKGEWVDWALEHGADPVEAEELTKQELIDLYGSD